MAPMRPKIRTYLDYNATAPLRPEAREAALVSPWCVSVNAFPQP